MKLFRTQKSPANTLPKPSSAQKSTTGHLVRLSILLSLVCALVIGYLMSTGVILGNSAQKAARPFISDLVQMGGQRICDNGDGGHGIDNTQPWYAAYYQIPDSPTLTDTVKAKANQEGFPLGPDTTFIKQLKGIPEANGDPNQAYGGELYNPKSDYLVAYTASGTLRITINRQALVRLDCDGGEGGGNRRVTERTAIIKFSLDK